MYRLTICTLDSTLLFEKNYVRESRASEAYQLAVKHQESILLDTIAALFEDNVVIAINEHKWKESDENSPWLEKRVTRYRPTEEQQARFKDVLRKLKEID